MVLKECGKDFIVDFLLRYVGVDGCDYIVYVGVRYYGRGVCVDSFVMVVEVYDDF